MQFIVRGDDGTDSDAPARRQAVREKHLENVRRLKETGNFIWGGAIIDEKGQMTGSVIVYDFPSRDDLDRMLETEPYITGGVWEKLVIDSFRLAQV